MNTVKKVVSVFFAILITLGSSVYAFADDIDTSSEDEIVNRYVYINSTYCNLSISGLTASCTSRVTAKSSKALSIKMELQKKSSGVYSTISTWNASKTGTTLSLSKTKTINPLSTYRLKVTFTAGSESTTSYSYP